MRQGCRREQPPRQLHKNVVRQLAFAVLAAGWLGPGQQIAGHLVHNLQITHPASAGKRRFHDRFHKTRPLFFTLALIPLNFRCFFDLEG